MTIPEGWYEATCTSNDMPMTRKDASTMYVPHEIAKNEDGTYSFKEYRFNIPIDYTFPTEVIETLATELDDAHKALKVLGVF